LNNTNIAQLVERCRAGDAHAIERFIGEHKSAIYRLALSMLDDPTDADEATQDVLVTALDALESFRGESALRTWLYAIALNVCRMRLRQRSVRQRLANTVQTLFRLKGETAPHPEHQAIQNEADAALWKAIHSLDEKHRLTVLLRYYHDLPVAEIAELLKTSERTVYVRLRNAHHRLKDALNGTVELT
jgi:RNA polymerase sigma-70 factor (ECF subfamily)